MQNYPQPNPYVQSPPNTVGQLGASFIETPTIDGVINDAKIEDHVRGIHDTLHDLFVFLKMNQYPKETEDIFKIVTLYKAGFGGNVILQPMQRTYTYIFAPVATAILVSSPLSVPVVVAVPATTLPQFWLHWDWPDGTSLMLDTSASANQLNVYVRYSMQY